MSKFFILTIALLALVSFTIQKQIYDVHTSNVVNLNPKNFDTQITQNRSKNVVSFIHFYTNNDSKSKNLKKEIEKMSMEYDGMFKIAALDCTEFKDLCSKQEVREFPTFKIYPPMPAPIFPYEGEIESKKIITNLGRFVDNKTVEIHSNNVDSYVGDDAHIPKVLLFTDKAGVPLIYKVLAIQFENKLKFGVVRKTETSITSKYKITTFPKIMVIPVGAKKNVYYDGENKFKPLFDFVNVYSETFFKVGEDKTSGSSSSSNATEKPWLNEKFPEVNAASGNDVCFKVEGIICVILINNGKPENKIINLMSEIQNYLSPKIDRGIKYRFSWMNSETQSSFLQTVGVESVPKVVLVNPGKRKRYFVSDAGLTIDELTNVFDKLASGDLRFKMFSQNTIPELAE